MVIPETAAGGLCGQDVPPDAASPRAEMVRAALRVFAANAGRPARSLRVTIQADDLEITFTVLPDEAVAFAVPVERRAPPAGLGQLPRAIVAALTDEPVSAETLARRAGYRLNSHFRAGIRQLERMTPPLCVRTADGYRAPLNSPDTNGRPLPTR